MGEIPPAHATPWWLRAPHLQTIAPALDRRFRDLPLEHLRHELPDGDFLDVVWLGRSGTGPIFVILPGMQGTWRSTGVRSLLGELSRRGLRAVVLGHRGGELPNRQAAFYHAGFSGHLAWQVSRLREAEPGTPLYGIGLSLGGSMLVRHLVEAGNRSGLRAAAAISLTFCLSATSSAACEGFNRVYQVRMLRSYKRVARLKAHLPGIASRLVALERARSIRELDDVLTAPVHGFSDAEDYYARCSSAQDLPRLPVPFLILNAADDPLVPRASVPDPRALPPHVRLELTPHGGHLGFVGRTPSGLGYYPPSRLIPFLLKESHEDEPLSAHVVGDDHVALQAGHAGGGAHLRAGSARDAQ